MPRNMDSKKLDRPLAAPVQFRQVGAPHKMTLFSWAVGEGTGRKVFFRGRCACGEGSGTTPMTTSGMVHSWHGVHIQEVLNAGTK